MILALVISIVIVCIAMQPSQHWFNGIIQEEFDQLGAKERLEIIVQQFNSSGNIFNSSALPIEHLRILISLDIIPSDIPETFAKYISDNIDYQSVEYNTQYQYDDPAVKVLNTGKASCLGMNILLANLILSYNNSIPTFLYFGTNPYLHHVITVCFINNTWYALDPVYYYDVGIVQSSNYSCFLSEINKYTTYYYSLSPEYMQTLQRLSR